MVQKLLPEAVAAVNRFHSARLEGNFGLDATGAAGSLEHFAGSIAPTAGATTLATVCFRSGATGFAAARRIVETLLSKELLLGNGKRELNAAVGAGEDLLGKHFFFLLKI
ncbi:MAG TPA: hypothetical protein V6C82_02605 [Chroococcales cyanobacterium]|jgi:hypothetical protein